MFSSNGILHYSKDPIKLSVEVDPEISSYYFSFIPKYLKVNRPMFSAHISIIRYIAPPNMEFWNKYHNQMISFQYESYIYNDELYYWLNVYSLELENIREELGLTSSGDVTKSPDGRHKFHITLGNLKNNAP